MKKTYIYTHKHHWACHDKAKDPRRKKIRVKTKKRGKVVESDILNQPFTILRLAFSYFWVSGCLNGVLFSLLCFFITTIMQLFCLSMLLLPFLYMGKTSFTCLNFFIGSCDHHFLALLKSIPSKVHAFHFHHTLHHVWSLYVDQQVCTLLVIRASIWCKSSLT